MILTPLWFLTYILVIGKIAGHLNDLPWIAALLPAFISFILEQLTIEVIHYDEEDPDGSQ